MIKDIKQLEVLKKKAADKVSCINKEITALIKERKVAEQRLSEAERAINDLLIDVTVSERAIIRYFERGSNFNINQVKDIVLPPEIKPTIKDLRTCECPVGEFRIVVKDNKVVTILKGSRE